jgi:virginiamycin B lyase
MIRSFSLAVILSGFAAFASACTNGPAVPPAGVISGDEPARLRASEDRVRIRQFADLPYDSGYLAPTGIAAGPGGLLWVSEAANIEADFYSSAVVAIATSGARKNAYYYSGPHGQGSGFSDIVEGPDGALWITDEFNEQIVRMSAQGTFTGFVLQNLSAPLNICDGPDKALWFTVDSDPPDIGRITTSGHIELFSIGGSENDFAQDVAAGSDGALWFTQPNPNRIGRITTTGKVTEYAKGITAGAGPWSIAPGPDGALWFTERPGGRIGRITTSGKVTEYSNGITPTEEPFDLAAGPDGAMWFTEYEVYGYSYVRASKIGRITMQGKINEYSRGITAQAAPTGIAAGPDGRMWFVENWIDKTGRVGRSGGANGGALTSRKTQAKFVVAAATRR